MRISKRHIEITYLDRRALKLAFLIILMALVAFFISKSLGNYLLPPSEVFAFRRVLDATSIGFLLVCIPSFTGLAVFIVAVAISQLDTRYLQPEVEARWALIGGLYGFLIPVGNMLFRVISNLPLNPSVQVIIVGLLIVAWIISPFLVVFKFFPVPDYEIQSDCSAESAHEEK